MTDPTNPYVGPRTFTREESDRFFGRETEARDLLSLVISERLVLFYAQSGAGKSSLLNTRLAPQLAGEGFLVLPIARISGELPEGVEQVDNIFIFNLLLSLEQGRQDPARFAHISLSDFLTNLTSTDGEHFYYDETLPSSDTAHDEAEDAYEEPAHVLIIDQFEEIITTHLDRWPERADFFRQLNQALQHDPLLWVVLTLREDHLAALDPYAPLLANRLRDRYYMQRMGYEAALEAIQCPAEQAGRPFTPEAAQTLADNLCRIRTRQTAEISQTAKVSSDGTSATFEVSTGTVLGQFIEPVHLQVVCYQLWENLKSREGSPPSIPPKGGEAKVLPPLLGGVRGGPDEGFITPQDLQELGDVDQALTGFYEDALQRVVAQTHQSERRLRDWFSSQLVTPARTRSLVYRDDKKGETEGLPNPVIDRLTDAYIIRADIRGGETWYELTHDRLVEPIIEANLRWQAAYYNPVATAYNVWLEAGHSPDKLLAGAQLQEAQTFADSHPLEVTAEENAFLADSQRQEEEAREQARQAAQRRRNLVIAGLVVIAILAGLTLWALHQANRASQAEENAKEQAATAEAASTAAIEQKATAEAASTAAISAGKTAEAERATAQAASTAAIEQKATAQAASTAAVSAGKTAEAERAVAEAADAAVAQQKEATEAEQNFSQTTDLEERVTYLLTLLELGKVDVVRRLFWGLPTQGEQLALFKVEENRLAGMIKELYINMADVNRTGYTDPLLAAMAEAAVNLPDTTPEAKDLKMELAGWLACRQAVQEAESDQALAQARAAYDALIKEYPDNPATRYDRASLLIEMGDYEGALADLDRVVEITHSSVATSTTGVEVEAEFATSPQMVQAARRLIKVNPALAEEFKANKEAYHHLAGVGLLPDPTVITDKKGIKMVLVEAGPFEMGSNTYSREQPVHQVILDAFYIDQFEVTNAQYAEFLNDQGSQEEGDVTWLAADSGYVRIHQNDDGRWQADADFAKHPVVGVSWYGANAYCQWREGRLPTEAEWEKAARGTDGRTYPWGENIACHLANYHGCLEEAANTTSVGAYPEGISPYGAYDMAGNVWEWAQSEYQDYPYRADDGRENITNIYARVLRGGSWAILESYLRAAHRAYSTPAVQNYHFGFRCAVGEKNKEK